MALPAYVSEAKNAGVNVIPVRAAAGFAGIFA
jgi:hypothetical protein